MNIKLKRQLSAVMSLAFMTANIPVSTVNAVTLSPESSIINDSSSVMEEETPSDSTEISDVDSAVAMFTIDKELFRKAVISCSPEKIVFTASKPSSASETTKLNAEGKILGYFNDSDNTFYVFTDTEGQMIYAPEDSRYLFSGINMSDMLSVSAFTNLSAIDCSALDTSYVTNMNHMFFSCKKISSVNLSSFNTSNVTDFSGMFYDCISLTGLDISNFDTSNATDTHDMFRACKNLKFVDLTNAVFSDNVDSANMLKDTEALKTINCSETAYDYLVSNNVIDSSAVSIADLTFDKDFLQQKIKELNVERIFFTTKAPNNTSDTFAISSDGTVLCSFSSDFGNTLTIYTLAEGVKVKAPADCSDLFMDMEEITTVDFSGLDFSDTITMKNMFNGCSNLERFTLGNSDTSKVNNMCYMFANCSALSILDLSGLDTSNAANLNSMFAHCTKLLDVRLSNFNTKNAIDMSAMFLDCKLLTDLDLSNFRTRNVDTFRNMFKGCSSLKSVDVSGFITTVALNFSSMFEGCSSLEYLNLSTFKVVSDGISEPDLAKMFKDCTALKTLYFNNLDISGLTDPESQIEHMFDSCDSLDTVYASEDVFNAFITYGGMSLLAEPGDDYRVLDIKMFKDYIDKIGVKNINFDSEKPEGVIVNGTPLNASGYVVGYFDKDEDTFTVCTKTDNEEVILPSDCSDLFSYLENLVCVRFYDIDTSQVTNMSSMFEGCTNLKSLYLEKFKLDNVTDMSNMFYGTTDITYLNSTKANLERYIKEGGLVMKNEENISCVDINDLRDVILSENIARVYFSREKPKSLQGSGFALNSKGTLRGYVDENNNAFYVCPQDSSDKIGFPEDCSYMFADCDKLVYVELKVNSNITNMSHMFENCTSLETIVLGSYTANKTTDMSYMFSHCESLESINWSGHDIGNAENLSGLFSDCKSLTSVNLSKIITDKVSDMSNMFTNCESLTAVDVSGFNTENVISFDGMFSGCTQLSELDLSCFDTSSAETMSNFFNGCSFNNLDIKNFNTSNVQDFSGMFTDAVVGNIVCTKAEYDRYVELGDLKANNSEITYELGDANLDGMVDIVDVVLMRQYLSDGPEINIDTFTADIDADGKVTLKDIVILREYLVGDIEEL